MTKRQNKCGNIKSKKKAQIQKEKQKGIDKDKIGVERNEQVLKGHVMIQSVPDPIL